jgi:hypothetical protein
MQVKVNFKKHASGFGERNCLGIQAEEWSAPYHLLLVEVIPNVRTFQ